MDGATSVAVWPGLIGTLQNYGSDGNENATKQ